MVEAAPCRACGQVVPDAAGACPHCQAPRTPFPALKGHRVIRLLGAGGMGTVYLAEDEVLGRRVAVKLIPARVAGQGDARTRFLREARAMATVEHPHIVRAYSCGEADGTAYIIMEYVEGARPAGVRYDAVQSP